MFVGQRIQLAARGALDVQQLLHGLVLHVTNGVMLRSLAGLAAQSRYGKL
jgi:hypothetical protein